MADPQWDWFDWRSWLWLACAVVGLAIAAILWPFFKVIEWLGL